MRNRDYLGSDGFLYVSGFSPAFENVFCTEVNPHAKGLCRLEESIALSQLRVRDHTLTFIDCRPFCFLALIRLLTPTGCNTSP